MNCTKSIDPFIQETLYCSHEDTIPTVFLFWKKVFDWNPGGFADGEPT
jgi:hypothetical protein